VTGRLDGRDARFLDVSYRKDNSGDRLWPCSGAAGNGAGDGFVADATCDRVRP
jgi:hypothetical protein